MTNERVLIITTTVRASRAKVLYEWPLAHVRVTALNQRLGDRAIQLFLSDGWGRNFTRHDGSKLSEWKTISANGSLFSQMGRPSPDESIAETGEISARAPMR